MSKVESWKFGDVPSLLRVFSIAVSISALLALIAVEKPEASVMSDRFSLAIYFGFQCC
jgi:hypothetical protein